MSEHTTQNFHQALPGWRRFLTDFRLPAVMSQQRAIRELRLRCLNLQRRVQDGPDVPLRVAFFGPTGAGKSKLFSSTIGKNVSHSGFKRPFTKISAYYVHDDWRSIVASINGNVAVHEDDAWRQPILVDTPDFDSVDTENRDEAERVFLEADCFLFVTDSLKYADASTWEYLTRIRQAAKSFVVILNKVESAVIGESFDERYRSTFALAEAEPLPYLRITVPEFPMRDDELIDTNHESIVALRKSISQVVGDDTRQTSVERFEGELTDGFAAAQSLREEVQLRKQQLVGLRERLHQRHAECAERLESRLTTGLGPAVRDEVYQRVMQRMDNIDLLRYPRKIISAPIKGLRSMYTKFMGSAESSIGGKPAHDDFDDSVSLETFHLLESEVIRFTDETHLDFKDQEGLQHLVNRESIRELRVSHELLKDNYRLHYDRFREWVQQHARDTAAEVTGENKMKFAVSQILFHTVMLTALVKSGGTLTLLEAGIEGVMSPFIAKAVSMAIGNEKVKEFEAAAHKQHQEGMSDLLGVARDRFLTFLDESATGLDELEANLNEIVGFQSIQSQLVEQFRNSDPHDGGNDSRLTDAAGDAS